MEFKRVSLDDYEVIRAKRGTRCFEGREALGEDGVVRTPVRVVRDGFRTVDLIVEFRPEPVETRPEGWSEVEGGVQAA